MRLTTQITEASDGQLSLSIEEIPALIVGARDCTAAADQLAAAREHAKIITGTNLDEWINGLAHK